MHLLLLGYLIAMIVFVIVARPQPQFVRTGEWCTTNEHYPQGICLGIFEWR